MLPMIYDVEYEHGYKKENGKATRINIYMTGNN